jgi:hypothetical protein
MRYVIFAILLSLCGCSFPTEPRGPVIHCNEEGGCYAGGAINMDDEDEEGDE